MNKEVLKKFDEKNDQIVMINVLATPVSSDNWENSQYRNLTKSLRLFGLRRTEIPGLFVKNGAMPDDKVLSFLEEEVRRQSELPSSLFNFQVSISKTVDPLDFQTAVEDGCLSKYADGDLVLTARWINM